MSHQKSCPKPAPSPATAEEYLNIDNYSQDRSPQYKPSNESPSSMAKGRVARRPSGPGQACSLGVDHDGFELVSYSEATASGPPSESTGSDDTIVNGTVVDRAAGTPTIPGSALTQNNMTLHDRVSPLGTMSTYQWLWGQPCPGGFDIKDTSSKDSLKVRVCRSRVSQTTEALENEFSMVNHPSEAFIACAGDWAADVAAFPATFEESLPI
ncbi:hypothetical protein EsH8_I_000913 [Colletotrichum jinshuiense]